MKQFVLIAACLAMVGCDPPEANRPDTWRCSNSWQPLDVTFDPVGKVHIGALAAIR